ncbi:MAG: TIGR04282 family arsenosugar biosynthesis glycosyltransferase [Candidatus Omnitrophica bacterium]|nr:TIGR04282 family arsenosugar biosynthesis glycosyltransferase [Candidatus Omnitrophota bacterium]
MGPNILLYFVKYPTPGKVKTRLAKTVGDEEAAKLYSDLAEKNLRVIASLYQRNICDLVIVYDPPERSEDIKRWLSLSCEYLPQCGEGLSERLTHAFHKAFQMGGKGVMALGSDTLGLTTDIIQQGFEALHSNDVVVGPAEDGGYYLIGLNHFQPKLFEGVPWSTNEVLPQTYKIINSLRLSYQTLCQLEDLDVMKPSIEIF